MADLVALCPVDWDTSEFSGNTLLACTNYQLLTANDALSQPDFFIGSPVGLCSSGFDEIVLGTSQFLACSISDFTLKERSEFLEINNSGSFMSDFMFNQLWLLIFVCGLLVAFGLGAIKGGQR